MPKDASGIAAAIAQIPGGLFVLTSHYEDRHAAVPIKWVQPCSDKPHMVMVALAKGQAVEPMIRDSRYFALCQISADDRFLMRKFGSGHTNGNGTGSSGGSGGDDPLVSMMTKSAPSGSPILDRALSFLDCEIIRHIELDCDYRIYVAQVHSGAVLNPAVPAVCFGTNGNSRPGT